MAGCCGPEVEDHPALQRVVAASRPPWGRRRRRAVAATSMRRRPRGQRRGGAGGGAVGRAGISTWVCLSARALVERGVVARPEGEEVLVGAGGGGVGAGALAVDGHREVGSGSARQGLGGEGRSFGGISAVGAGKGSVCEGAVGRRWAGAGASRGCRGWGIPCAAGGTRSPRACRCRRRSGWPSKRMPIMSHASRSCQLARAVDLGDGRDARVLLVHADLEAEPLLPSS